MLIVEDDAFVRMMFSFDLPEVELFEARGLAEADEIAHSAPPEVVVVDRKLIDGDGLDVIRRFRSRAPLAHIPMVVLTAGHDPAEEPMVLSTGADAYIAKPCEAKALMARVKEILAIPAEDRRAHRLATAEQLQRGA